MPIYTGHVSTHMRTKQLLTSAYLFLIAKVYLSISLYIYMSMKMALYQLCVGCASTWNSLVQSQWLFLATCPTFSCIFLLANVQSSVYEVSCLPRPLLGPDLPHLPTGVLSARALSGEVEADLLAWWSTSSCVSFASETQLLPLSGIPTHGNQMVSHGTHTIRTLSLGAHPHRWSTDTSVQLGTWATVSEGQSLLADFYDSSDCSTISLTAVTHPWICEPP